MISCDSTVTRTQLAGANRPYEVDVSLLAVSEWTANAYMPAGSLLRPSLKRETGFVYQNVSSGQTGISEPAWSTGVGSTTSDGSLTWNALAPPAGGEDSIQSVTWSQVDPPDSALTITDQAFNSLVATASIGGGTSGNVYVILVQVTMISRAIYSLQIILTTL